MRGARAALLAALLAAPLSGCVVAAVPAAAAAGIVRARMQERRELPALPQTAAAPVRTAEGWTVLSGATELPPPSTEPAAVPARTGPVVVPPAMQYLYGSGEGAALGLQAYGALTGFVAGKVASARGGAALRQVVIADGAALDKPYFEPCGDKPPAIILDVDETALLNLGYEGEAMRSGTAFDDARWARWERTGADKVAAVPGAAAALAAIRKQGVAVIFNSNRSAAHAAQTVAALDFAGLGPVKHGTTLWLKGDDGGGSAKDARRWAIASGYCVIAMVGDQLGDFSDQFNAPALSPAARRAAAAAPALAAMWGAGWFLLPNPVYGPALRGGCDDVFPVDRRWSDAPAGATPP